MFGNSKKPINEQYVKGEITKIDGDDVDVVAKNKEKIAEKLTDVNVLRKYAELGKVMLGMLTDYKNGVYKNVPWFSIAAIAFAFLYLLNPLDIIPDFIPGLGYLDDFAVFTFSLKFIESDLHNYLDWKLEQNENESEA